MSRIEQEFSEGGKKEPKIKVLVPDAASIYWTLIDLKTGKRKGDSFSLMEAKVNDAVIENVWIELYYDSSENSFLLGGTIRLAQPLVLPRDPSIPEIVQDVADAVGSWSGISEEEIKKRKVKKHEDIMPGLPRDYTFTVIDPESSEAYAVRWHVYTDTHQTGHAINDINVFIGRDVFLEGLSSLEEGEKARIQRFKKIIVDYANVLARVIDALYVQTELGFRPHSGRFKFEVPPEKDDEGWQESL